jgi:hypothetical protein
MTFRVATWNLDHASKRSRPVLEQVEKIKAIKADIWVLTETCDRVDLSAADYQCKTPRLRNKYNNFWTTVWARNSFELGEQLDSCDDGTVTCVRVHTPGGWLVVYGTILTWKMDPGAGASKPWEEHHKDIAVQGADWARLKSQHSEPLIVAGDFNQTRDKSRRYCSDVSIDMLTKQLKTNKLECVTEEDFGREGHLGADPKKGYYRHNVDHICVPTHSFRVVGIGVWDHFVGDQYLSDHNGVFVDLAWQSDRTS